MRPLIFALILGLAGASSAQAGAWLRERGKSFSAFSVQATKDNGNSASFYFEYGLSERVTFGFDSTYDTDLLNYLQGTGPLVENLEELPQGSGILFLRFPIGSTDQTNKWAFHVGAGARYLDGELLEAAEVGLSWGRGIKIGERYGWLNVDSSYNTPRSPAENRVKLDGTFGLGLTEKAKIMMQIFNTFEAGETYTKVAPSLLYTPRADGMTIQLGSEILVDSGDASLKLGVWFEF